MPPLAAGCLARNDWICGEYVSSRREELLDALTEHVTLLLVSLLLGIAISLPLALLARRVPALRSLVLGTSTALYTVPSLAMFSLLVPFTGLSRRTVVIGLVLYSLTILVRNVLAGLEGVPAEVREAAVGMGLSPRRLLWRIELPLALPTVMAGVRVAAVSTVALTTVGAIVGYGGLGDLIYEGLRSFFRSQVLTASVLCVALAVVCDVVLLGVQRLLTPWVRRRAAQ